MKSSDFIEATERFFNDIIGTLIPGIFLIIVSWYLLNKPIMIESIQIVPPNSSTSWIILIISGYILGHFVISFGNMIVIRIVDKIIRFLKNKPLLKWIVPKQCKHYEEIIDSISNSKECVAFREFLSKQYPNYSQFDPNQDNIHSLRSIAMTIASEETHIVHRFMFISLFNLGISSVILLFIIFQVFLVILSIFDISIISYSPSIISITAPLVLLLFLLDRRYEFYSRALRVPFSMVLAKSISNSTSYNNAFSSDQSKQSQIGYKANDCYSIYLAGGFHSNWQDSLIDKFENVEFLDPRKHELKDIKAYTSWDLKAIEKCDCVFAYLESTNPGGYALACEIGYAKAINKMVILVDEKSSADGNTDKYFKMIHGISNISCDSLQDGIMFLEKYLQLEK